MPNSYYEVQKWTRILNHPKSTEAQKEEARQKVGLTPLPGPAIAYRPEYDELIESWLDHTVKWHPLDERPPVAEKIYSDIVKVLICGGSTNPAENEGSAARLLSVLPVCKTLGMIHHTGSALLCLLHFSRADLADGTAQAIRDALREDSRLPDALRQRIEKAEAAALGRAGVATCPL
jgi:hypothetical protein